MSQIRGVVMLIVQLHVHSASCSAIVVQGTVDKSLVPTGEESAA
jgi:hypothetical protein